MRKYPSRQKKMAYIRQKATDKKRVKLLILYIKVLLAEFYYICDIIILNELRSYFRILFGFILKLFEQCLLKIIAFLVYLQIF